MHLSDRLLINILSKPSTCDAEELLHALAQEVRLLRSEVARIRQTFVPLRDGEDPRGTSFLTKFQDLCMTERIAAAAVLGYAVGDLVGLRYGGHQGIVTALLSEMGRGDDHG